MSTPRFADIRVGDEITPLERGPITPPHLMRWSAAIENWHRIHYDHPFAVEKDGLPSLLVNGTWKQHFLVEMMQGWLGPSGWLASISFSFRRMDLVGDILVAKGMVTDTRVEGDLGFVTCEIGIWNPRGENSTPGIATGVLPIAEGAVPRPFEL